MKRQFLGMLAAGCMLLLAACGGQSGGNTAKLSLAGGGMVQNEVQGLGPVNDWTSSIEGRYRVQLNSTGKGGKILYLDYETGEERLLCAREGCQHEDISCGSYIGPEVFSMPWLAFTEGNLLVIYHDSGEEASISGVERLDADGANRRMLAKFDGNQMVSPDGICADGENLYFRLDESRADGSYGSTLNAVSLETGTRTKLGNCSESDRLLGGSGRSLFVERSTPPELRDSSEFETKDAYEEYADAQTSAWETRILRVDPANAAQLETVEQWTGTSPAHGMLGGVLYSYDSKGDCFTSRNYTNGEVKTMQNTSGKPLEFVEMRNFVNGKLIVSAIVGGTQDKPVYSSFAVDFAAGTINEIGLLDSWGKPVLIYGTGEDRIYVRNELADGTRMDDTYGEIDTVEQKTAYLTVEDFFAGKANYTAVNLAD